VPPPTSASASAGRPEKSQKLPFAVSLSQSAFLITAFAEAWEFEDNENMFGGEDNELGGLGCKKGGRWKGKDSGYFGEMCKCHCH
jgi:hypothetical protein